MEDDFLSSLKVGLYQTLEGRMSNTERANEARAHTNEVDKDSAVDIWVQSA